jgi:hypothetical protein
MIAMPDTVLADVGVVGLALARASVAAHSEGPLCKGSCCTLDGRAPFSRLVYPAAQDAWLGGHLTLDPGGQAKFCPDPEWLDVAEPDGIDYAVDPARAQSFYAEIQQLTGHWRAGGTPARP